MQLEQIGRLHRRELNEVRAGVDFVLRKRGFGLGVESDDACIEEVRRCVGCIFDRLHHDDVLQVEPLKRCEQCDLLALGQFRRRRSVVIVQREGSFFFLCDWQPIEGRLIADSRSKQPRLPVISHALATVGGMPIDHAALEPVTLVETLCRNVGRGDVQTPARRHSSPRFIEQ